MNMKKDFNDAFIESTKQTFLKMMGLHVQISKSFVRGSEDAYQADISGIIGFSQGVTGVFVMGYPLKTALAVVSKFIDEEATKINEDVIDAIGEISNIIAGHAKKDIADKHIPDYV
jgi:chemotaxis protein CheX